MSVVSIYLCESENPQNKFKVCSASQALSEFDRLDFDDSDFAGRANSYTCPIGADPGAAYLLMTRKTVESLDDAKEYTLVMSVNGEQIDCTGLYLSMATRVVPGKSQDTDSLYVVELFDKRWLMGRSRWISRRYNIRDLEQTDDEYRVGTTKDATEPWTWEEIFEDLWGECDDDLIGEYSFTGFQDEVNSIPENLFYQETTPWSALCDCVRRVGCEVIYDPQDGTFRIVQMGAYDETQDTVEETLIDQGGVWKEGGPQWNDYCASQTNRQQGDLLIEDRERFMGRFRFPRAVKVVFPTNFPNCQQYGASYSVTVYAGEDGMDLGDWWGDVPIFTEFSTYDVVYDPMQVRLESEESNDAPLNLEELQERAREVAILHYRKLLSGTPSTLVFSGIKTKSPGRHIHSVIWGDLGDGLKTHIERYKPQPIPVVVRPEKPRQSVKTGTIIGVRMKCEITQEGALPELDTEDSDNDGDTSEVLTPGVNCKQKIQMYRVVNTALSQEVRDTLSGHWRLGVLVPEYEGTYQYTEDTELEYNATASDVQAALEAMLGILPGDVTCTGGPIDEVPITVEFTGELGDQPIRLMRVQWGEIRGGYDPLELLQSGKVPVSVGSWDVLDSVTISDNWAVGLQAVVFNTGSWTLNVPSGQWRAVAMSDIDAWDSAGGSAGTPGDGTIRVFSGPTWTTFLSELPGLNYTSVDIVEEDYLYAIPIAGYWHVTLMRCG